MTVDGCTPIGGIATIGGDVTIVGVTPLGCDVRVSVAGGKCNHGPCCCFSCFSEVSI